MQCAASIPTQMLSFVDVGSKGILPTHYGVLSLGKFMQDSISFVVCALRSFTWKVLFLSTR